MKMFNWSPSVKPETCSLFWPFGLLPFFFKRNVAGFYYPHLLPLRTICIKQGTGFSIQQMQAAFLRVLMCLRAFLERWVFMKEGLPCALTPAISSVWSNESKWKKLPLQLSVEYALLAHLSLQAHWHVRLLHTAPCTWWVCGWISMES